MANRVFVVGPDGRGPRLSSGQIGQPLGTEILVRLKAASLNARDLAIAENTYSQWKIERDTVPLCDGAGEVVAVGDAATAFRPGDRVAATFYQELKDGGPKPAYGQLGSRLDGTLREFALFDESGLVPVPPTMSLEEAATLPCAALTAWNALYGGTRKLLMGETVLLLGTGSVSLFALQFAVAAGARAIVTSSDDEKLAQMQAMGAHATINYRACPDWGARAMEMTGGAGIDHIVEVGGPATLPQSMQAMAEGAQVSLIGSLAGPGDGINPHPFVRRRATLRGVTVGTRDMFFDMLDVMVAAGIHPLIGETYDFADAPEAFARFAARKSLGKTVIRI